MAATTRAPIADEAPTQTPLTGELRAPIATFRLALVGVCGLLTVLPPHRPNVLFLLLVLSVGMWAGYRSARFARPLPFVEALLVGAAVPWTGAGESPLLPYLLAPGLILGLTRGPREVVLVNGCASSALLVGIALPGTSTGNDAVVVVTQWLLLSLALGLVATWARRLSRGEEPINDEYREVRVLLEHLRGLTRHLPGGLDAPSAAEALLDRCSKVVSHNRSAVLVQPLGGTFVPLAVHGARRVPWRTPLEQEGPLRTAWESGQAVRDSRQSDKVGRRGGSSLVALPLLSSGGPFGLVILEATDQQVFHDDVVDRLQTLVTSAAAQLETAMLFEEVRLQASTEERDRLAREMHDGIAQELAYFGYRLDELRNNVTAVDPELGTAVAEVRGHLTSLISDIRLSITDLRTTVRHDRGLGAALSAYLNAVCSGKDLVLTVSLHETAFRLPAEQEVALFKAAQAFAQDVRRSTGVTTLTARLIVDPPSARLRMSCDGPSIDVDLGDAGKVLVRLGAKVTTSGGTGGGPSLDIEMRGGPDDDQRPADRRPRLDQGRPAAGVRAD